MPSGDERKTKNEKCKTQNEERQTTDGRVYPIWQDPGAPPHRPHVGASDPVAVAELTAKTLSLLAVLSDPHCGHFTFSSADFIERTSCSNFPLHDEHVYS